MLTRNNLKRKGVTHTTASYIHAVAMTVAAMTSLTRPASAEWRNIDLVNGCLSENKGTVAQCLRLYAGSLANDEVERSNEIAACIREHGYSDGGNVTSDQWIVCGLPTQALDIFRD
jgi:hypothetical protein